MKQTSYVVAYKDHKGADVLLFGPFASPSIADFFKAALPEPLTGGYRRQMTLQPFMAHEGHTVHNLIMAKRSIAS